MVTSGGKKSKKGVVNGTNKKKHVRSQIGM